MKNPAQAGSLLVPPWLGARSVEQILIQQMNIVAGDQSEESGERDCIWVSCRRREFIVLHIA